MAAVNPDEVLIRTPEAGSESRLFCFSGTCPYSTGEACTGPRPALVGSQLLLHTSVTYR